LLALAGVTLGVQLTVLAANPAPCFRYMAAPMFIGVLCLSLIPALRASARWDRVDSCTWTNNARSCPRRFI
jgi:hypothetical protein